MSERIQKVLARAGVGSRRQVEEWIRTGRLTINGAPATPGAAIAPHDRIALDGRPVRLRPAAPPQVLIYHRTPLARPARSREAEGGETNEADLPPVDTFANLPRRAGARWVPVSPLPPNVGGLELLTTDGTLAQALGRKLGELPVEFALRVRGELTADQMQLMRSGVFEEGWAPLTVEAVETAGGGGFNRWVKLVTRGGRARDVHRLCAAAGFELSRLMRTALGPLKMDRSLARERTRQLEPDEVRDLYLLAGLVQEAEAIRGVSKPEREARPAVRSAEKPVRDKPGRDRASRNKPSTRDQSSRDKPAHGKPARRERGDTPARGERRPTGRRSSRR